jgi:hypothetical protein
MGIEEFYLLKGIYLADGVAIAEAVVVVPSGSQSHHEVRTSKIISKLAKVGEGYRRKEKWVHRKLSNLGLKRK